jgi:tetratricopeptide (TPR) repeat protein
MVAVWCALVVVSAEPGSASAALAEANALQERRKLAEGYEAARRALQPGDATAEETWAIYQTLGELAAAMGYADDAKSAFSRALELNPGLELSALASPRLQEPFRAAKAALAGAALSVKVVTRLAPDGSLVTELDVSGDANQLVRSARLKALGEQRELSRGAPMQVTWSCPAARCEYTVSLHDDRGNTLWTSSSGGAVLTAFREAPKALEPAAAPEVEKSSSHPLPWGIAAVLLAVTGGVLTGLTVNEANQLNDIYADPALHYFGEAQARDGRANVLRLSAGGAFALALGCALVMVFQL